MLVTYQVVSNYFFFKFWDLPSIESEDESCIGRQRRGWGRDRQKERQRQRERHIEIEREAEASIKTETKSAPVFWLNPQRLGVAPEHEWKPRVRDSVHVSLEDSRNPVTWANIIAAEMSVLTASWSQEQSWPQKLGTSVWRVGILASILTARPNALVSSCFH